MAKFLLGLIAGALLCILTFIVLIFAMARSFRESPPVIADESVLELQLDGDLPERPPVEVPLGMLAERPTLTVTNVWMILRKAAVDTRIKAVVLEPQGLSSGWGKLEEFSSDLERFKKSGKPLWAYLKTPGARDYYVASAADRIYLGPTDWLNVKGMRVELLYFKNTLDKLGIDMQFEHAGKYKDFGDTFTRTSMSPETNMVMNSVLDGIYGNFVSRLAQGRRKDPEEVRTLIDQGPFLAKDALQDRLVDTLGYEDQMFAELSKKLHTGELHKLTSAKYMKVPAGSLGLEGSHRIALLVGQGAITRGSADDDGTADQGITAAGFNKLLRRIERDSTIDGVVVRIDSPGGDAVASDAIWRQMNLLSKKKPVVISMSDTAASGGYYMAMTGDPILAYPGTLTGSIGVVFGKPDLRGLYDKLGVTKDVLTRGRFAAIDSDYKKLDNTELEKLRAGIDANYRDFVQRVADARRRTFEQIEPLAQGRVWLGAQAQSRGLVDSLGGLDQAIALVKQKVKIPASEHVTLIMYPPRRSIFDVLFGRSADSMVESRLRSLFGNWPPELWLKGGLLRLMPFGVAVE